MVGSSDNKLVVAAEEAIKRAKAHLDKVQEAKQHKLEIFRTFTDYKAQKEVEWYKRKANKQRHINEDNDVYLDPIVCTIRSTAPCHADAWRATKFAQEELMILTNIKKVMTGAADENGYFDMRLIRGQLGRGLGHCFLEIAESIVKEPTNDLRMNKLSSTKTIDFVEYSSDYKNEPRESVFSGYSNLSQPKPKTPGSIKNVVGKAKQRQIGSMLPGIRASRIAQPSSRIKSTILTKFTEDTQQIVEESYSTSSEASEISESNIKDHQSFDDTREGRIK